MAGNSTSSNRTGPSLANAFTAFQHRNYRLFFIGQFISMCGTWLQSVAQGWLVWQLSHSAFWVGMVTACGSAPMLFFSLAGGATADRVDRRRLLLVTQTFAMLLAALLGYLAMTPHLQVWEVAGVATGLGFVNAFDIPARQAFVVEMVDRETLMNAIALNSSLTNGARIVGPAFAGALLASPHVGVSGCFFLNSASYIAAITALTLIRVTTVERTVATGSAVSEMAAGLRYVVSTPVVRRLMILLGVTGIFGWSISVLLPPMADHVLHGNAGTYGLLMTAQGVGALLGSLLLASLGDTPHKRSLVYGGLVLFCLSLFGFSLCRWVPGALFALALAGVGMILFFATGNTVIQAAVPDELRGRVMGVWTLVFSGSTPLGSLQAGLIAGRWGAQVALQVGVAIMIASGLLVYRESSQERERLARESGSRRARA